MKITDLNGLEITVTDLQAAIAQAKNYKEYRHDPPDPVRDCRQQAYWTDIYHSSFNYKSKIMETIIQLLDSAPCPLLFGIGLAIRLIVGMRQFNRRGLGGLQHFNNYFTGIITLSVEWLLKWIAFIMMVWGLSKWLFS